MCHHVDTVKIASFPSSHIVLPAWVDNVLLVMDSVLVGQGCAPHCGSLETKGKRKKKLFLSSFSSALVQIKVIVMCRTHGGKCHCDVSFICCGNTVWFNA